MEQPIQPEPVEPSFRTLGEYILYKLDRTIAIVGIIGITMLAMKCLPAEVAMQIASAGIGGLIGYVGGRTGK